MSPNILLVSPLFGMSDCQDVCQNALTDLGNKHRLVSIEQFTNAIYEGFRLKIEDNVATALELSELQLEL